MKPLITEQMENVHKLKVPLKVDLGSGPNWRDVE
jgi:DNA polymerase I-like protein with 3'-5' exonuclease and polymerase domains